MAKTMTKREYEEKKIKDKKRFFTGYIIAVVFTIVSIIYCIYSKQVKEWASQKAETQTVLVLKNLILMLPKLCGSLAVIFISAFIVSNKTLISHLIKPKTQRGKTNKILIGSIFTYSIVLLDFILVLVIWGADVSSIVGATGGIVVFLGLCLQSIIQDFVCGVIVVFENHIQVGETITCCGEKAVLKEIGTRVSILEDANNNILVINNSSLRDFINHSRYTTSDSVEVVFPLNTKEEDVIKLFESNKEALQAKCPNVIGEITYGGMARFDSFGTYYYFCFDANEEDVDEIKSILYSSLHTIIVNKGLIK